MVELDWPPGGILNFLGTILLKRKEGESDGYFLFS